MHYTVILTNENRISVWVSEILCQVVNCDAPTSQETILENKTANISKRKVINKNKIAKILTFA